MRRNIYIMSTSMKKKINNIHFALLAALLVGCSLSPGMYMSSGNKSAVYIEGLDRNIIIKNINDNFSAREKLPENYLIGVGDKLNINVYGIPEVFPLTAINPQQNVRRVNSEGNIFFPYVGTIKAIGKNQDELRKEISLKLSEFFSDPQLDLNIVEFNSQVVFLLGEVTKPTKINITDVPLSLSDAIGGSLGLNTNSAEGSEVFIIRQGENQDPEIFIANLESPSGFIDAGKFYLQDNDIVYVNAKGTTRWNRVISQFFPFSSFLNSIDNLTRD